MQAWLQQIRRAKAIAVIRTPHWDWGLPMATAAIAGGIELVEITWNSDRPAALIQQLRHTFPDQMIGAGTLLTVEHVKQAIAAGAQFLFTPHVNPALIEVARQHHIPLVAGALTPTEIITAWQAGATSVKVFPVHAVGGAAYIRSLQAPLGDIPLIPTGGVTVENAATFLQAGAIAVGLSSSLFPASVLQTQQWLTIEQYAAAVIQTLASV